MKRHEIEELKDRYPRIHRLAINSLGNCDWSIRAGVKKLTFNEDFIFLPDDPIGLSSREEISATIEIIFEHEDMMLCVEGEVKRVKQGHSEPYGGYLPTKNWEMEFSTFDGYKIDKNRIIDAHEFLSFNDSSITEEIVTLHELVPTASCNSVRFKNLL